MEPSVRAWAQAPVLICVTTTAPPHHTLQQVGEETFEKLKISVVGFTPTENKAYESSHKTVLQKSAATDYKFTREEERRVMTEGLARVCAEEDGGTGSRQSSFADLHVSGKTCVTGPSSGLPGLQHHHAIHLSPHTRGNNVRAIKTELLLIQLEKRLQPLWLFSGALF